MSAADGEIDALTDWQRHQARLCLAAFCQFCAADEHDRTHEAVRRDLMAEVRAAFTEHQRRAAGAQEWADRHERLCVALRALGEVKP